MRSYQEEDFVPESHSQEAWSAADQRRGHREKALNGEFPAGYG